jgi:hypothetical protein
MSRPLFLNGTGASSSTGTSGGSGSTGGLGSSGPASLTLSPGTQTSPGVWSYNFGEIATVSALFTITNTGGTATAPLVLSNFDDGAGFGVTSDHCTNTVLGAGQSCTFTETWMSAADPLCDGRGNPDSDTATVTDANQAYIEADLTAVCG